MTQRTENKSLPQAEDKTAAAPPNVAESLQALDEIESGKVSVTMLYHEKVDGKERVPGQTVRTSAERAAELVSARRAVLAE